MLLHIKKERNSDLLYTDSAIGARGLLGMYTHCILADVERRLVLWVPTIGNLRTFLEVREIDHLLSFCSVFKRCKTSTKLFLDISKIVVLM